MSRIERTTEGREEDNRAETRNLRSTGERSAEPAGPRTPGEDKQNDPMHKWAPPETTNYQHPTAPGTLAAVPGEGVVQPGTEAAAGKAEPGTWPGAAPGAMQNPISLGNPPGPPMLGPEDVNTAAQPCDPGGAVRIPSASANPDDTHGHDLSPGSAAADLGAAGGGASGPGNADPNWPGANTGGAVASPGGGGVAFIEAGTGGEREEAPEVHAGSRRGHAERVRDVMTISVEVCTPSTDLQYVARMMADRDVGAIPVVENTDTMRPIGIITDRDIAIRVVAKGQNPYEMRAGDVMSGDVVTVTPETSLNECQKLMEDRQIRRVIVVDEAGRCIGMVAQADIAMFASPSQPAEVVREISEPSSEPNPHSVYH